MGLTIHWTLSTPREFSDAVVRELVVRTKAFAQKIGCEEVIGPKRVSHGVLVACGLVNSAVSSSV